MVKGSAIHKMYGKKAAYIYPLGVYFEKWKMNTKQYKKPLKCNILTVVRRAMALVIWPTRGWKKPRFHAVFRCFLYAGLSTHPFKNPIFPNPPSHLRFQSTWCLKMTVFLLLSDDRIHTAFKSCIYLWLEGLNLVKFGSCIISLRLSTLSPTSQHTRFCYRIRAFWKARVKILAPPFCHRSTF